MAQTQQQLLAAQEEATQLQTSEVEARQEEALVRQKVGPSVHEDQKAVKLTPEVLERSAEAPRTKFACSGTVPAKRELVGLLQLLLSPPGLCPAARPSSPLRQPLQLSRKKHRRLAECRVCSGQPTRAQEFCPSCLLVVIVHPCGHAVSQRVLPDLLPTAPRYMAIASLKRARSRFRTPWPSMRTHRLATPPRKPETQLSLTDDTQNPLSQEDAAPAIWVPQWRQIDH